MNVASFFLFTPFNLYLLLSLSLYASLGSALPPSSDTSKNSVEHKRSTRFTSNSNSSKVKSTHSLSAKEIDAAFKKGKNAYLYGTYPLVIKSLQPLISPHLLISTPENLLIAYEYLGLAYFYLNQKSQAHEIFTRLIFFRPDYELDPVRTPPDAVTFYTQLKEQLADEIKRRQAILKKQKETEEQQQKAKMSRKVIVERQVNQKWIALLPFGIGQFQNQDSSMGYFFLISEALSLSASVVFFWGVEGLRQSNGLFPRESFTQARNLQTAQMISVGLSLGLMITGIVHAFVFYKDSLVMRRFERPLLPSISSPSSFHTSFILKPTSFSSIPMSTSIMIPLLSTEF